MNKQLVKYFITLLLAGLCLATIAAFPNYRNTQNAIHPAIVLQQPTPPPTPTPRPNCPVPPYPAAAYGYNPYPIDLAPYFDQAGLNRLGNNGPSLPVMDGQSPYVPCTLLKVVGYQESGWRHFETGYNGYGYTEIGDACDYGLMQIVSGMSGGGGFDANRTNAEIPYNIGTGARTLINKWNALKLESGGYPGGSYIVGDGDSKVVEDWYYAIWAYNNFSWLNNPNNNCSVVPWSPSACPDQRDPNRPPFDGSQDVRRYPYQELIWGYAAHPPDYNGSPIWEAINLTLPGRAEVGGTQFTYPNKTLPRPVPYHHSCGNIYLPIIMKNWTAVYFFDTFKPINGGWTFYSNHSGRVADHVHVNTNTGHGDNRSLYITEQIDLYSYTSGARITLNVPPGISPLWLSFWYRRADPTYGGYQVRVDGQVEISHSGSSQSWQLETEEISSHATDGQITLDFRVPAKTGNSHDLLFDEIMISTFQPSQ